MVTSKSLDDCIKVIAALLSDVQTLHTEVLTPRQLRLTTEQVVDRCGREGMGFLTKALPRLGKATDVALLGEVPLNATGFQLIPGSKLPRFLGELFQCIFSHDGMVLPAPCVLSIKSLRQVLYSFYKYDLPYDTETELTVLSEFERTDDELRAYNRADRCSSERRCKDCTVTDKEVWGQVQVERQGAKPLDTCSIIERARQLLRELFCNFDPGEIVPTHGPGSLSTKEEGPGKYRWSRVSPRIAERWPLDAYFYATLAHVCDNVEELKSLELSEHPAKVVLVPKDSRGPRLISEESLDSMWIQQGLRRAIYRLVETHPLTRDNVHFTNQRPNQLGALLGSLRTYYHTPEDPTKKFVGYNLTVGRYATLDLKEASDRVSIGLVRALFPEHILEALMACRSLTTVLPNGKVITLNKFAPMGSALCFPTLALTIWAILTAGLPDAEARESLLVYGDDVIVPTAQAANAIKLLEAVGLMVNKTKSCTTGFFRESCGVDAYLGVDITPVKFKTAWASARRPDVYVAWIAYANELYKRRYFNLYDLIVARLIAVYGEIPEQSQVGFSTPALIEVPEEYRPKRRRVHHGLQMQQWYTYGVEAVEAQIELPGWSMLLRYFSEGVGLNRGNSTEHDEDTAAQPRRVDPFILRALNVPTDVEEAVAELSKPPFSVRSYTKRDTVRLVRGWYPTGYRHGQKARPKVDPKIVHVDA